MNYLNILNEIAQPNPEIHSFLENYKTDGKAVYEIKENPEYLHWVLNHFPIKERTKENVPYFNLGSYLFQQLSPSQVKDSANSDSQIEKVGHWLRNFGAFKDQKKKNLSIEINSCSANVNLNVNPITLSFQSDFWRGQFAWKDSFPSNFQIDTGQFKPEVYQNIIEYLHLSDQLRDEFMQKHDSPTLLMELYLIADFWGVTILKLDIEKRLLSFQSINSKQLTSIPEVLIGEMRKVIQLQKNEKLERMMLLIELRRLGILCELVEVVDYRLSEEIKFVKLTLQRFTENVHHILQKYSNLSISVILTKNAVKEAARFVCKSKSFLSFRWITFGTKEEGVWKKFPRKSLKTLFKNLPKLEKINFHPGIVKSFNCEQAIAKDKNFIYALKGLNQKVEWVIGIRNMIGKLTFYSIMEYFLSESPAESIDLIKSLNKLGFELFYKDYQGNTPLHHCRDVSLMMFLLENGADPNIKNNKGDTPLHFVARLNYIDLMPLAKLLLDFGANINVKNNIGRFPLNTFIREGGVYKTGGGAVLKCFLDNGALVLSEDNKNNALTQIINYSHLEPMEEVKEQLRRMINPRTLIALNHKNQFQLRGWGVSV